MKFFITTMLSLPSKMENKVSEIKDGLVVRRAQVRAKFNNLDRYIEVGTEFKRPLPPP